MKIENFEVSLPPFFHPKNFEFCNPYCKKKISCKNQNKIQHNLLCASNKFRSIKGSNVTLVYKSITIDKCNLSLNNILSHPNLQGLEVERTHLTPHITLNKSTALSD
jgi:hypothetical protein